MDKLTDQPTPRNMPAKFPRRVATGLVRRASGSTGRDPFRGTPHCYNLFRDQALYQWHAARAKVNAA